MTTAKTNGDTIANPVRMVDVDALVLSEENPRTVTRGQFNTLKASIRNNPDFFEARPVVASDRTGQNVVIAGNQRLRAAVALGMERVPTVILHGLSEERERELTIRDNVNNGQWDFDKLANSWNLDSLKEWGAGGALAGWPSKMDTVKYSAEDTGLFIENPNTSTGKFQRHLAAPMFLKTEQYEKLRQRVEAETDPVLRELFEIRLAYFVQLDFASIAAHYYEATPEQQATFEALGLVLLGSRKLFENGFTKLADGISELVEDEEDE